MSKSNEDLSVDEMNIEQLPKFIQQADVELFNAVQFIGESLQELSIENYKNTILLDLEGEEQDLGLIKYKEEDGKKEVEVDESGNIQYNQGVFDKLPDNIKEAFEKYDQVDQGKINALAEKYQALLEKMSEMKGLQGLEAPKALKGLKRKTDSASLFKGSEDMIIKLSLLDQIDALEEIVIDINQKISGKGSPELQQKIADSLVKIAKGVVLSLGVGTLLASSAVAAGVVAVPASVAISSSVSLAAAAVAGASAVATVGFGIKIAYDNAESIQNGATALLNAICEGAKITGKTAWSGAKFAGKTAIAISATGMQALKEFVFGVINFAIASPLKKIFMEMPKQVKENLQETFDWVKNLKPADRNKTRDSKENFKDAMNKLNRQGKETIFAKRLKGELRKHKQEIVKTLNNKYNLGINIDANNNISMSKANLTQENFVNFMKEIGGQGDKEYYSQMFNEEFDKNKSLGVEKSNPNQPQVPSKDFCDNHIKNLLGAHIEDKAFKRCVKSTEAKLLAYAGHAIAHAPMFAAAATVVPIAAAYQTIKSLTYEFTVGAAKDVYHDIAGKKQGVEKVKKGRLDRVVDVAKQLDPREDWGKKVKENKVPNQGQSI